MEALIAFFLVGVPCWTAGWIIGRRNYDDVVELARRRMAVIESYKREIEMYRNLLDRRQKRNRRGR